MNIERHEAQHEYNFFLDREIQKKLLEVADDDLLLTVLMFDLVINIACCISLLSNTALKTFDTMLLQNKRLSPLSF